MREPPRKVRYLNHCGHHVADADKLGFYCLWTSSSEHQVTASVVAARPGPTIVIF